MIWELVVCIDIISPKCAVMATFPNAKTCYVAIQEIKTPLNSTKTFYCKPAEEKVANV